MKKFLLILIGLSTFSLAEFTKIGNIVSDSVTGLQWQDDINSSTTTWQTAITYCEDLSLEGHDDWRLPNLNELKSIIDRSKSNPAIVDGFINTSSISFWSSTSYVDGSNFAWYVYFGNGYVGGVSKDGGTSVRCVRAGE